MNELRKGGPKKKKKKSREGEKSSRICVAEDEK
jgi:hypothetical protein